MGPWRRRLLELVRAGALAAGTMYLLGLWFQGMARLGLRESFPDGGFEVAVVAVAGILLASFLGFPGLARGRDLVLRVLGTALAGLALAAAVGAGAFLLARFLDVAERDFPIYFAVVGGALVAVGLRRLPRGRAARLALGVPAALLLVTRLLATWPGAAHALTSRLFPLPPTTVRSELERLGWGQLSFDQRTRIVDLQTTPSYRTDHGHLVSDSTLKFTLEAVRPFFEDACGDLHTRYPFVAPFVHSYPTREACEKEHPARHDRMGEMYHHTPSPCCGFAVKERRPGERFNATRTWEFVFKNRVWRADH